MGFLEYSVGNAEEGKALTDSSTPKILGLWAQTWVLLESRNDTQKSQATVLGTWRTVSILVREEDDLYVCMCV